MISDTDIKQSSLSEAAAAPSLKERAEKLPIARYPIVLRREGANHLFLIPTETQEANDRDGNAYHEGHPDQNKQHAFSSASREQPRALLEVRFEDGVPIARQIVSTQTRSAS